MTKRRLSRRMKATVGSRGRNLEMDTCRMATLPSTTTAVRLTDWTVTVGDEAVNSEGRLTWKPKSRCVAGD